MRWLRRGLALGVLVVGLLALSYLQGRFDRADEKKALLALREKIPSTEGCQSVMVSRLRGLVRVECAEGSWLVDVVRGHIGGDYGK